MSQVLPTNLDTLPPSLAQALQAAQVTTADIEAERQRQLQEQQARDLQNQVQNSDGAPFDSQIRGVPLRQFLNSRFLGRSISVKNKRGKEVVSGEPVRFFSEEGRYYVIVADRSTRRVVRGTVVFEEGFRGRRLKRAAFGATKQRVRERRNERLRPAIENEQRKTAMIAPLVDGDTAVPFFNQDSALSPTTAEPKREPGIAAETVYYRAYRTNALKLGRIAYGEGLFFLEDSDVVVTVSFEVEE